MNSQPLVRSQVLHACLWLSGGAVVLGYAVTPLVVRVVRFRRIELSSGAAMFSLTSFLVALAALTLGAAQWRAAFRRSLVPKLVALLLLLLSFAWLLFMRPFDMPWLLSAGMGLILIASVWQMALGDTE
jgi:fatty acid desaturase